MEQASVDGSNMKCIEEGANAKPKPPKDVLINSG